MTGEVSGLGKWGVCVRVLATEWCLFAEDWDGEWKQIVKGLLHSVCVSLLTGGIWTGRGFSR